MRSINSINKIDELRWTVGSYLITIIYIAFVYLLGFIVPALKKAIIDYERTGSAKSISMISSVSSVLFTVLFVFFLFEESSPASIKKMLLTIGIYAGCFIFGFLAMTLWYDDMHKTS